MKNHPIHHPFQMEPEQVNNLPQFYILFVCLFVCFLFQSHACFFHNFSTSIMKNLVYFFIAPAQENGKPVRNKEPPKQPVIPDGAGKG